MSAHFHFDVTGLYSLFDVVYTTEPVVEQVDLAFTSPVTWDF